MPSRTKESVAIRSASGRVSKFQFLALVLITQESSSRARDCRSGGRRSQIVAASIRRFCHNQPSYGATANELRSAAEDWSWSPLAAKRSAKASHASPEAGEAAT